MFKFFKKSKQTTSEQDNLNKTGKCFLCPNDEDESMFNLFGIEVCEGCYHDLINHMGYKNLNDLLECDKKQLMLFLNKLSENKRNNVKE